MNQPKQPANPPQDGASPDTNPSGETPHGIPKGIEQHEPKGTPTSDREKTESAPHKV
jgi:hypothetical protein